MTYSTEQKDAAAHLLCSMFPRLHYGVARTWVTAEAGANNNVFGVKVNNVLQKYPTMERGVAAAAYRIRTLGIYRAVLSNFSSPHDVPKGCPGFGLHATAQVSALCRSPWHSGVSGLKEQGGLDLYYARVFRSHGYTVR